MGSPTIPAAPSAPDYGAATREGVYADIDTLDTRRQIENAARLGKSVQIYNPVTGAFETKDFTGLGDAEYAKQAADLATQQNEIVQRQQLALREELGEKNAQQTRMELRASDPTAFDARQDLTSTLRNRMLAPDEEILGSQNVRAGATLLADLAYKAPASDSRLGNLYAEADGSLKSTASDLGQIDQLKALQTQTAGDGAARTALGALQGQADAATRDGRLGSIYDEATRLPSTVTDPTSATLNAGLQGALEDYQLGGKLDDTTRRDLLNEVRAGQVARGNYLGDAAAVVEATELGNAAEQRKAQRLQTVLAAQSQAFGQNSSVRDQEAALRNTRLGALTGLQAQDYAQQQGLRNEQAGYATGAQGLSAQQTATLAQLAQQIYGTGAAVRGEQLASDSTRLGQLAGLAGQDFGQQQQAYGSALAGAGQAMSGNTAIAGEERAARAETLGRSQQKLANVSAMVLGQPITNQFGSLAGAQQGAVGFTPIAYQGGTGLNQNAGQNAAGFAQGNYGTASSNWNTSANIAAQGSPWMALAGQVAGGAAGGAGAALGAMI